MSAQPLDDFLHEPERYELDTEPPSPLELDRREFFRIVGGGLVVALVLGGVEAQQPGGRRGGFGGAASAAGPRRSAIPPRSRSSPSHYP